MNYDETRAQIKERISCSEYLEKSKSGLYCCPYCGSGNGTHGTGAVKFYPETQSWYCHACGRGGDVFDLVEQVEGLDRQQAFSLLADRAGLSIDRAATAREDFSAEPRQTHKKALKSPETGKRHTTAPQNGKTAGNGLETHEAAPADYTDYYKVCRERLSDPAAAAYLTARGIRIETAAACGLGFDPAADPANAPGAMGDAQKPHPCPRLIVPSGKSHYVGRRIDGGKDFDKVNAKGSSPGLFNVAGLYAQEVQEIFIVEGAFDALSILEAGYTAIALNSASNTALLLEKLESYRPAATLVLCPDNDSDQQTAERVKKRFSDLGEELQRRGISFLMADINGAYKDANEHLTGSRESFVKALSRAAQEAAGAPGLEPLQDPAELLPGLLTYDSAVKTFETADDSFIELRSFPAFSALAKIRAHDTIALAADTGAGKSSLALNILNDLNETYPCIYINLEMDDITVLRRLAAIHSGLEIDRIEGYRHDENTAAAVNATLKELANRQPLQMIRGVYKLEEISDIVQRSTQDREQTTIVIIDHALLVNTQEHTNGRYDRFTQVSEGLRRLSLACNVVLFVLLQQSRQGKENENEPPKNSSLKESGSWENDATHISFLWYDPTAKRKKLLLTKNRSGSTGEITLSYSAATQNYTEAQDGNRPAAAAAAERPRSTTKREKKRQKLEAAFEEAYYNTFEQPTLSAMAEAADVTTGTIKAWIKEVGGYSIDGAEIVQAGAGNVVERLDFAGTPLDDF